MAVCSQTRLERGTKEVSSFHLVGFSLPAPLGTSGRKCVIGGIGLCKVMQATTEKSAEIILSLPLTHRFRIVTYAL